MFKVGDRVQIHDHPNEWGSGIVTVILENGALVSIDHGIRNGMYYFFFDELEKVD